MSISAISFMSAPATTQQVANKQVLNQQAVAKTAAPAANATGEPAKKKSKGKIAALCITAAGIAGLAYAAKKGKLGKLKPGKASGNIVNDAEKVHARIVANNQRYLDKANDILARKGDTLSEQSKQVLSRLSAKYQSRLA